MIWYLRSLADGDTHLGDWQPDGTVIAKCGLRFDLPAHNYPGLSGDPSDPEQACRKCRGPIVVPGKTPLPAPRWAVSAEDLDAHLIDANQPARGQLLTARCGAKVSVQALQTQRPPNHRVCPGCWVIADPTSFARAQEQDPGRPLVELTPVNHRSQRPAGSTE